MLTFSELVKNNVAPANYNMNVVTTTGNDRFIINYNNIWGCISDTHMSKGDDGEYYITGQLFMNPRQSDEFLYATFWGGYCFHDSSVGCTCLANYLEGFGYSAAREARNGDFVLHLIKKEEKAQ